MKAIFGVCGVVLFLIGGLFPWGSATIPLLLWGVGLVCLLVALLPHWPFGGVTVIHPELDSKFDKGKIAGLIELINRAHERVYLVAGELHPSVFDSVDLADALTQAARRGVDVRIIMGDRERDMGSLKEHLELTNKQLLEKIGGDVDSRRIALLAGPRESRHFHIMDDSVILEEPHAHDEANIWHRATNTWYLADAYARDFRALESRKQRLGGLL